MAASGLKVGVCGFPVARARVFGNLDVVEVQQTFYDPPSLDRLRTWRTEAPESFCFTVKAWQLITHPPSSPTYRRLKSLKVEKGMGCGFFVASPLVEKAWQKTLECAELLNARIILFQTPPSFKPLQENINAAVNFFRRHIRENLEIVFEPRGWSWDAALKIYEQSKVPIVFDPLAAEEPPSDFFKSCKFLYLRLHGGKNYRYRYTKKDLAALAERVERWGCSTYVLFNNVYMFENAVEFRKMMIGSV